MRLQRGRQGAGDHDLLPGCAPPRCTRPLEAPLPWPWTAQGGPTSSWRAHRKAQAQRTTRSVSRESARRPHDEHVGSRASPPKVPENIAQDPRTVAPGPTQCSGGASTRLPLYAPTAAKAPRPIASSQNIHSPEELSPKRRESGGHKKKVAPLTYTWWVRSLEVSKDGAGWCICGL